MPEQEAKVENGEAVKKGEAVHGHDPFSDLKDFDNVPEEEADPEDMPLISGIPAPAEDKPWWLTEVPKKVQRPRWPGSAKSPSWFKRMSLCARNHAQKYRYKRQDPSGLVALVGNAVHGALQHAALRRIFRGRRATPPPRATKEELMHLLSAQEEILMGEGTEVFVQAAEIIDGMDRGVDFTNAWGAEYLWRFHASPQLKIAGYADLVRVVPGRTRADPPATVIVVDYKTGPGRVPTRAELERDPQACLELMWARRNWPQAQRVRFQLWNVTQGKEVWIDWSPALDLRTLRMVQSFWHLWTHKVETPNAKSETCSYCAYRSDCQAYAEVLRAESYRPEGSLDAMDIEDLMAVLYEAKIVMNMADARRKDAAKRILGLLAKDQRSYEGVLYKAIKKSKRVPGFRNESDLIGKLAEATESTVENLIDAEVVSIKKKKLEAWVNALPEDKQPTAKALIKTQELLNYTAPWIEVTAREEVF
jgi:hypothetical protein